MNFINHTQPGSLDSGDSLECIGAGVKVAGSLLRALDAEMSARGSSTVAFGTEAEALREWKRAARALLRATSA